MSEIPQNTPQPANDEIDLIEVARKIWDGRKTIFKWMGIFFVIGIIIIIFSPKEYKSEVTLLVETGSGSSGMSGILQQFGGLAGLSLNAAAGDDALTPEIYPSIIKSTPFLLEVMDKKVTETKYDSTLKVSEYIQRHTHPGVGQLLKGYTLGLPGKLISWIKGNPKYSDSKANIQKRSPLKLTPEQSGVAGQLLNRIKTIKGKSLTTFSINVEMQDPMVAAQIADSVVSSLTRYIIDYRTQKAKNDLKFVEERHAEAEVRYKFAQRNLAGYRDRNKNVILASAQTSEQNLQAEYNLAFNVYNTLSQQLEQAKMKVQEKTPVFKVVEPAKVALSKSKPNSGLIVVTLLFLGGFTGIIVIFRNDLKSFFK